MKGCAALLEDMEENLKSALGVVAKRKTSDKKEDA